MEDSTESYGSVISKQQPSVQKTPLPGSVSSSPASTRNSRSSLSSWRNVFRSGRTCPTCNGTGRIPHGQEEELVALIPYGDKRLRPRRRWCVYLAILLTLLLVCGSVLLAFMFPRSASIQLTAMNSSMILVPYSNSSDVTLPIETHFRIKNDNFFKLEVKWLKLSLFNSNNVVGDSQQDSFSIRARADATAIVYQNATFTGALAEKVRTICTGGGWSHCLSMRAEAEMEYTVLSHKADTVTSKYFYVSCDFLEESDWTDTLYSCK